MAIGESGVGRKSLGEVHGSVGVGHTNPLKRLFAFLGPAYLVKQLLSPSVAKDLQFMILTIPPGGGSGDMPYSSPGEKGGLMLEGSLRLFIGDDVVDLREAESFQFDSSIPHHFKNIGQTTTQVLWITCQWPRERHI